MSLKDMRESLAPEQVKIILEQYGVHPTFENQMYVQFPTACHNLEGGSPKLYYYKENSMFKCYTECDSVFDIFELIRKMEELRGNECSLPRAIQIAGFDPSADQDVSENKIADRRSLDYYDNVNKIILPRMSYEGLQDDVLRNYSKDIRYLEPWTKEGITREALSAFDIRYDILNLAIVIPHKDIDGNIIGVRGRFMAEDSPVKYMPLSVNGTMLSHSLRGNLYGLYENMEPIMKHKSIILFESEKSVLKFSSFFGHENNFSVATCGNKVSNEQIQILQDLGIKQVILAFDKDYTNSAERAVVQEKYNDIGKRLSVYFNTYILLDYANLLGFKDAPIDRGKEVFMELFNYKYPI